VTDLIQVARVPGGQLGMLMASNGVESIQNAIDYDRRQQSFIQNANYDDWYVNTLNNMSNNYTEKQIMSVQQTLMDTSAVIGPDWVYDIDNIEDLQTPNYAMANYIMAHPFVSKLAQVGIIEGYSSVYISTEDRHSESYYEVMNGTHVSGYINQGEFGTDTTRTISENYMVGSRTLNIFELASIFDTWSTVDKALKEGFDFTAS